MTSLSSSPLSRPISAFERVDPRRTPRPFLKWAGGKGQLLDALVGSLPDRFARYHEPFLGGGALFFALKPKRAVLSDVNTELIDCWTTVRDDPEALIAALGQHPHSEEHYYEVRAQQPQRLGLVRRAARTIFLNKTGFNGLYRVNSRGEFNVPFGRHVRPRICDVDNLRACAAALAGVELSCAPFERVLRRARPGDLVYFDPPYVPVSRTASFTAYHHTAFGIADQERLALVFERLAARQVAVMLSNADVPWVRERFARFRIRGITARRCVNCNTARRGPVGEVIVTNY